MIKWDVVSIALAGGLFSWALVIFLAELWEGRRNRTRLFDPALKENIDLPYALDEKRWKKENVENIEKDHLKKQLSEAGVLSRNLYLFFRFAFPFAIFLPFVFLTVALLTDRVNMETLTWSLASGAVLYFSLRYLIYLMVKRRKQAILRGLPDLLDLLIICIESGLNFMAALERTLKESDRSAPLTKELDILYHEYLGGLSLASACTRMSQRADIPEVTSILSAIIQSERLGLGLGHTLRVQASDFRDKYRQRIREKAFKVPVKLVFPVVLILTGAMLPVSVGPVLYKLKESFATATEDDRKKAEEGGKEYYVVPTISKSKR
ncbi:MAG: type II secretion system F family protein [Candidatus Omnitrophica bacterium]|nr:type II secretion system F family protein [Candidatus Omnitrophota bacterium]